MGRRVYRRIADRLVLAAAFVSGVAMLAATGVQAATLTVINTDDSGLGSFRQAITDGNSNPGPNSINFNLPGTGPFTIKLQSPLPAITNNLTITGSTSFATGITIDGNQAVQLLQVAAGGTLNLQFLTLANGSLMSSVAVPGGASVFNQGILSVANCIFSGNQTTASQDIEPGVGGAIFNLGTLTVTNSTFTKNQTTGFDNPLGGGGTGSGGAIASAGSVTISGTTFSNNEAIGGTGLSAGQPGGQAIGGAVWAGSGSLTIVNSTFSANQAQSGAGGGGASLGGESIGSAVSMQGATGSIVNSTFFDNQSTGPRIIGGTIDFESPSAILKASILAQGAGGNCFGNVTDGGYNLSDDGSCDFAGPGSKNNVLDSDLDLGSLSDNGGPTQTIALTSANSVAVDQVPKADCSATDQRGYPRPDRVESFCDIGAFEFQDVAPFAKFHAALAIDLPDNFLAVGSFTPAKGSPAADPTTQDVTLTFSSTGLSEPESLTIPAGSFKKISGQYYFQGKVGYIDVTALITAPFKNSFGFLIAADGLELSGVTNPVGVTLQVGSNTGTANFKALIF